MTMQMTVYKYQLRDFLQAYRNLGLVKGGELLLPPEVMLRLADDLEAMGIAITGVTGWHYVDPVERTAVVEDLTADFTVSEAVLMGDDPIRQSVAMVKDYIMNSLPEQTAFVSFTLDIPLSWERELLLDRAPKA